MKSQKISHIFPYKPTMTMKSLIFFSSVRCAPCFRCMGAMDHFPFQVVNVWGSTENGKGIPKQFQICMYVYIYMCVCTPPKKTTVLRSQRFWDKLPCSVWVPVGGTIYIYSTPRDSRSFFGSWILNLESWASLVCKRLQTLLVTKLL